MNDDTTPTLNSAERLDAVLYQFVNLYERWSEDRQVFAKKGADLSEYLELLKSEIARLEKIDNLLQQTLIRELNQLITQVRNAILETATNEAKKQLWQATQTLKISVEQTEKILRQSRWEITKSRGQWFAITVISAIASSVLATWLFLAK